MLAQRQHSETGPYECHCIVVTERKKIHYNKTLASTATTLCQLSKPFTRPMELCCLSVIYLNAFYRCLILRIWKYMQAYPPLFWCSLAYKILKLSYKLLKVAFDIKMLWKHKKKKTPFSSNFLPYAHLLNFQTHTQHKYCVFPGSARTASFDWKTF